MHGAHGVFPRRTEKITCAPSQAWKCNRCNPNVDGYCPLRPTLDPATVVEESHSQMVKTRLYRVKYSNEPLGFPVVNLPIAIIQEASHGWRKLIAHIPYGISSQIKFVVVVIRHWPRPIKVNLLNFDP